MHNNIIALYNRLHNQRKTAVQLSLPLNQVKKVLLEAGSIPLPDGAKEARELFAQGYTIKAIMDLTGKSRTWVYKVIPYKGKPYKPWKPTEKRDLMKGVKIRTRSANACSIMKSRLKNVQKGNTNEIR